MLPPTTSNGPTPTQRQAERHRPEEPAVMFQRWENLLFVHWRWDPVQVQQTLPQGLTVDTYHGGAWIGLAPVFMRGVRPSFLPAVPLLSDFLELNFRTYVYDRQGRPGVYFHSLDCNQPLIVEAARRVLQLNYEHSQMEASLDGEGFVNFTSQRVGVDVPDAFRYRPLGAGQVPDPASLDFFLIERYRFFSVGEDRKVWSYRVHHPASEVRPAESVVLDPVTIRLAGFDPRGRAPDHICMVNPLDVEVFMPEPVEEKAASR